jgi:outer membrane protein
MNKTFAILSLGAIFFGATANAMAQEADPWLVRFRAVNVSPANDSDPIGGVGAADRISVQSKTIPEVDFSYFFTPNIAAELVLTYPQKHNVYLDGSNVGSFKELPPTLLLQYHFLPKADIDPYLGAGINYTRISNVNILGGAGGLDSSSIGGALQAGADFKLNKAWSLNLDVKKVWMSSDVTLNGARVSSVQINPWLIGVGFGYRF